MTKFRTTDNFQCACILSAALTLSACSEPQSNEAFLTLGDQAFSQSAWSGSDESARGAMIYSFLKEHSVIGMKSETLIGLLGEPTGYHEYDHDLAYFIGGNVHSQYGEGYLLVFFIKNGLVDEYRTFPTID